jgi:hypothetical protein
MDPFFKRLIIRAATVDELLSDRFEPLPGQKPDAERAARRLAEWCRSCASGDWSLFNGRLERDGLSFAQVLPRLATGTRGSLQLLIGNCVGANIFIGLVEIGAGLLVHRRYLTFSRFGWFRPNPSHAPEPAPGKLAARIDRPAAGAGRGHGRRHRRKHRAGGGFQRLVGNGVGEDVFIDLVEVVGLLVHGALHVLFSTLARIISPGWNSLRRFAPQRRSSSEFSRMRLNGRILAWLDEQCVYNRPAPRAAIHHH